MNVLNDPQVRLGIKQAWDDSQPGAAHAHEEGGFVLMDSDGRLVIERWPHGVSNTIIVPARESGRRNGKLIAATFHTHPLPPPRYAQEPSWDDVKAVALDPNLAHSEYEGEYVIARHDVFLIRRDGSFIRVGDSHTILEIQ